MTRAQKIKLLWEYLAKSEALNQQLHDSIYSEESHQLDFTSKQLLYNMSGNIDKFVKSVWTPGYVSVDDYRKIANKDFVGTTVDGVTYPLASSSEPSSSSAVSSNSDVSSSEPVSDSAVASSSDVASESSSSSAVTSDSAVASEAPSDSAVSISSEPDSASAVASTSAVTSDSAVASDSASESNSTANSQSAQ